MGAESSGRGGNILFQYICMEPFSSGFDWTGKANVEAACSVWRWQRVSAYHRSF